MLPVSNRAQRRAAAKRGKRQGETYADVLAQKRMIKEAVEKNVHDRSVAIEADIKGQRLMWMSVVMAAELKAEHPNLAQVLYNISVQEDAHQAAIHGEVVKLIEDYRRKHGDPPPAMKAVYEYVHERHIEKLAEARRYQDLYKSS